MPNSEQFLSGFGLIPGLELEGYELVKASSTHETIVRYKSYKYRISLIFVKNYLDSDINDFLDALDRKTDGTKRIKAIRNFYNCRIDEISEKNVHLYRENGRRYVRILLNGYAER